MRKTLALFFILFAPAASAYDVVPGVAEIAVEEGWFADAARDRRVPYKMYRPASLDAPAPVLIFSHGLGGSVDAAGYLGSYLASHGWISLHIQHPGTDSSIWESARRTGDIQGAADKALGRQNYREILNRFQDLPFVLDELERMNAGGPLAGKIALDQIAMAGHSFGAKSTLAAVGQSLGRRGQLMDDDRIKAGIAMSPSPNGQAKDQIKAHAAVDVPVLHLTGTEDGSPVKSRKMSPEDRLIPFESISGVPQVLVNFEGANHGLFGGNRSPFSPAQPTDDAYLDLIKVTCLAFLEAHVRGDAEARAWLQAELSQVIGEAAEVRLKN